MDEKKRKRIQTLITKLSNSSEKETFNALLEIRKNLLKAKEGISFLSKYGGIHKIVQILSKDNVDKKTTDITLSILGNICMDEDARKLVKRANGIEIIAEIFTESEEESIQNRCARTLANLALTHENISFILKTDAVEKLATFLQSSKTKENLLTYSRTARLLAKNARQLEKLISENVILYLAKHLEDSDEEVKFSILRSVLELSSISCSPRFAKQIVSSGVVPVLLSLLSHHDDVVIHQSITLLHRLSHQPSFRPGLGSAGGIVIILDLFQNEENLIDKSILLNILCDCCTESVNRIKIRDNEILQVFLSCIVNDRYSGLHDKLISTLHCFVYDDASFSVLLENGLVGILIKHLQRVAEFQSVVCSMEDIIPSFIKEDEIADEMIKDKDFFSRLYKLPTQVHSRTTCTRESESLARKNTDHERQDSDIMDMSSGEESQEEKHKSVVYSIHSPTYIPHSNWDIDQYTKGETCKQIFRKSSADSWSSSSPLSTVSYYSPKSSPGNESPTSSNQYMSSPYHYSFCSTGSSVQSGNDSSPDQIFSESTVNKDPMYGMICSVPYTCSSPVKMDDSRRLSPISSLTSYYQENDEFSSCESGDEESGKDVLTDLNGVEKYNDEKYKSTSLETKTKIDEIEKENLGLKEIKITEDDISAGDQLVNVMGKGTIDVHAEEVTQNEIKSNKTKRTSNEESYSDVEETPAKKQKRSSNSDSKVSKQVYDTENQIMILLSRVSQMNNPSLYLVTIETVCCLLDYLNKVANPLQRHRAARLLSRVTKNPLCFQKLLKMKFVLLVYYKFNLYKYENELTELFQNDNCILQKTDIMKNNRKQMLSTPDFRTHINLQCSLLDVEIEKSDPETKPSVKDFIEGSSGETNEESQNSNRNTDVGSYFKAKAGLTLLQDMCIQADSHFGRGEVKRLLYRYPDTVGEWLPVDMIYVLWMSGMQEFYLTRMKFLDKILEVLQQNEAVHTPKYQAALHGLCFLGKIIDFQTKHEKLSLEDEFAVYQTEADINKQNDENSSDKEIHFSEVVEAKEHLFCKFQNVKIKNRVEFELENKKLVCCRNILSESSPLFTAMLHGQFMEANQDVVLIEDTTFHAFQYLIHYLHKCSIKCDIINHLLRCEISNESVSNIMEIFSLVMKYMVGGLHSFLQSVLSERFLTPFAANHIFHFALLHDFADLADDSVVCVARKGDNLERMKSFYKFLNEPNRESFLMTFRDLFIS